MIRLFVSDVDGTLLDGQAHLGNEEAEMIGRLQQHGIIFMLASGRNNYKATLILKGTDLQVPTICLNGAGLYDAKRNRLLSHDLPLEAVDDIHRLSLETNTVLALHANERIYSTFSEEEVLNGFERWKKEKSGYQNAYGDLKDCWFNVDMLKSQDYDFIRSEHPAKAEFIFCSDAANQYIRSELAKKYSLNMVGSGFVNNLEITDIKAEKGKMIRDYCRLMNIGDDEVAVIGDSDNDTGMFREYPRYSFAMGNSPEHVKKQASYITDTNDNHGFLRAAEKILEWNEAK